jgi:PAS domain S-box-containing protein
MFMNGVLHVMLLYDNPDDRAFVMRELNREFRDCQFYPVTNAQEFVEAISSTRWDLALTDYPLRWSDGITMSRAIKARQPDCIVMMFTGRGSEEVAVEAMKAGLDDYVTKPPRVPIAQESATRLGAAVHLALERSRSRQAVTVAELHYKKLFDDAPVGLFRVTPIGQIIDGNPALAELLHFPSHELLMAANLLSLFAHSEKRREFQGLMRELKHVRHFEARLCCCDDQIICAGTHARPVRDHQDHGLYYEGSLEDISDRKDAEKELRERLEELRSVSVDLVALRDEEAKHTARAK